MIVPKPTFTKIFNSHTSQYHLKLLKIYTKENHKFIINATTAVPNSNNHNGIINNDNDNCYNNSF